MSDRAVIKGSGWDDYLVAGTAVGSHPTSSPPSFEAMPNHASLFANNYATGDQAWFSIHIIHNYKAGSLVYPHVHWTGSGTGNGGDVGFEFSYAPATGYGVQAFPATTEFTVEGTPSATADTHEITEASEAQAFNTNLEIDSIVLCRIKRVAPAGTDYNGDVFIHQLDFHVETDGRKTNEKNAPHTKRY